MANHTPAPWSSSPQKGTPGHCFTAQVWDSSGNSLAIIEPTETEAEASANARLIAAAPEMTSELEVSTSILELVLYLFGDSMAMTTKFGVTSQIEKNKELIKSIEG